MCIYTCDQLRVTLVNGVRENWTTALVVVSLALVPLDVAGGIYLISASILGLIFMGIAVAGFRTRKPNQWARAVFLYSLVYMNLMVVFLAVDHQIGWTGLL